VIKQIYKDLKAVMALAKEHEARITALEDKGKKIKRSAKELKFQAENISPPWLAEGYETKADWMKSKKRGIKP